MKKFLLRLGNTGVIFITLLALILFSALALADPQAMLGVMVLLFFGIAMIAATPRLMLLGMRGALGMTTGTLKMLLSGAAVPTAFTIAKHGADDDHAIVATGATDKFLGILQHTAAAAAVEVSIMLDGISPVVYGGAVTRGDPLTSDASGRAITATTDGQSIIGHAAISGVLNDIGFVKINIHTHFGVQATAGNTFKSLAIATFDATGGKAIGAHGLGVYLPDNAIVVRSWYENLTTFTSATDAGTIALGVPTDAAAGIKAAVAISNGANAWDAGLVEGLQTGAISAAMTKLTAERELTATIAVEDLTAGKLRLYAEYVVSI